ncbi:hypothetical protein L210DRAFT_935532 [Boletus edulis BED1]|uniref:Uncharacterized protein n=1 Tax=Boletus edulis BED1 TaxID=1328754 RepID=A0AAD4BFQ1_BOLED|nr:hypothetical protein L210DRAFT_935532 [Boletus edulis BED1]
MLADDIEQADMRDASSYKQGLFFSDANDKPALVAIPCRDGVLQFDYWLRLPAIMNHHLNRWDISSVSLQSHTFYHLPASNAPRFQTAYTIKYWSQDMKMPINQALLSCCNDTPSHHLLRGDLIVIKHLHTPLNILQNMQEEDMALVTALIGWSVIKRGDLMHVDEMEYTLHALEND